MSRTNTAKNMKSLPPTPLSKQKSIQKQSSVKDINEFGYKIQTTSLKNVHWFRWDTNEVFRMNAETKNWELRDDIAIT